MRSRRTPSRAVHLYWSKGEALMFTSTAAPAPAAWRAGPECQTSSQMVMPTGQPPISTTHGSRPGAK